MAFVVGLRFDPMLVNYLLNWFTILFLSVQQFPSDVINLSFILVFGRSQRYIHVVSK